LIALVRTSFGRIQAGVPQKFIARSRAMPLRKFVLNFLDPQLIELRNDHAAQTASCARRELLGTTISARAL
jgi:hypothetical protein